MLVVEQWPRRRDACLAQAAAAATATSRTASSRGRAGSGAAVDAVSSHAAATLAWLADHNNMEVRIVAQLVSLRGRVTASTGAGIFSGWLCQVTTASASCEADFVTFGVAYQSGRPAACIRQHLRCCKLLGQPLTKQVLCKGLQQPASDSASGVAACWSSSPTAVERCA